MTSEFERIRKLSEIFGPPNGDVVLSIGDDAALLRAPANEHLVWTIDACVQDVHFRDDIVTWNDVGYRSLMAAASDLAAMGARPMGALSSITLPKTLPEQALLDIAYGQHDAARQLGISVVGGNLASAKQVTISTTLIGRSARCPQRGGARPGDVVAVFGSVGLASAGLSLLLEGVRAESLNHACRKAIQAWQRPVAHIDAGLSCVQATSLIDVSDGLVQDALHVARASQVRMNLTVNKLVEPELVDVAKILEKNPIDFVLAGGEDYALLATFAPNQVPPSFQVIGSCTKGQGVWINDEPCLAQGYDHFG